MSHLEIAVLACLLIVVAPARPALGRQNDLGPVRGTIELRSGLTVPRDAGSSPDLFVRQAIEARLQQPLSPDGAAQLALLLNPSVQATYAMLGIARADLLQAGLLKNPELETAILFPDTDAATSRRFTLTQDVLDIFLRPLRRRVAAAELEQAKLKVADALWKLIADVKTAWYKLAGTRQLLEAQRAVVEAAELAAELSRRQRVVGNVSVLDYATQQAAWQQARLELTRSEADVATEREELGRLTGLTGTGLAWEIAGRLPDLPARDPDLSSLETLAVQQRFDLAAARQGVEALNRSLDLTRGSVLGSVKLGVETETDTDGTRVTGPVLSLELPIFDRQQGRKARLRSQIRQSVNEADGLRLDVLKDVRVAYRQLAVNRLALEAYERTLLPLQAEIVEQSQRQYNFMLHGVYELLLAKQNELSVRRDATRSQKAYWVAWTELERALAGRLPKLSEPAVRLRVPTRRTRPTVTKSRKAPNEPDPDR